MTQPRLRFAPSPTGHLHIGGARTALYNWLLARQWDGTFILRIEDTDRERSTQGYVDSILASLRWLGLDWDEGPYFQTNRTPVYEAALQKLVAAGKTYPCTCTPEELEAKRKAASAAGLPPRYDRTCRDKPRDASQQSRPHCLRFKSPTEGTTVVDDLIRGHVTFQNAELDDLVIARTNGTPTYNLCVVADDIDMRITHVVRGDDHLNNTPRQIQIYAALGQTPPSFAHIPLILGPDRSRLSKRHGATSVTAYIEQGYLPEAMVNWLARIGWAFGDEEIFSLDALKKKFSLESVSASAGVFNPEKLVWLNGHYIRESPPSHLAKCVAPFLVKLGIQDPPPRLLERAVAATREKVKTLFEMADTIAFFFRDDVLFEPEAVQKHLAASSHPRLEAARKALSGQLDFSPVALETTLKRVCEDLGCRLGELAQPLRVALTGRSVAPGIYDILAILGKEASLARLDRALTLKES